MSGFIGTKGDDEYYSRSTKGEVILGLGGDDRLVGYRGDDVLQGGDGDDTLIDEEGGADRLYGGYGLDFSSSCGRPSIRRPHATPTTRSRRTCCWTADLAKTCWMSCTGR